MISQRTLKALSDAGIRLEDLPGIYTEGNLDKIRGVGKVGIRECEDYIENECKCTTLWYNKLSLASYDDAIGLLRSKYGLVPEPYFRNEKCCSRNPRNSKDHLHIHHVMEREVEFICRKEWALESPWEYQLPENLVYCNPLEHLILHLKLYVKPNKRKKIEEYGLSGVVTLTAVCMSLFNDLTYDESQFKTAKGRAERESVRDGENFFYYEYGFLPIDIRNEVVWHVPSDNLTYEFKMSIVSGKKIFK